MFAHATAQNHEKTNANGTIQIRVFLCDDTFDDGFKYECDNDEDSHVCEYVRNAFSIVHVCSYHEYEYCIFDATANNSEKMGT